MRSPSVQSPLLIAILVGLVTGGGCRPAALSPEQASTLLAPRWIDDYLPLDTTDVPPWPRNLSPTDAHLLSRTERVVVATLDPYANNSAGSFHGHEVLGARQFDNGKAATIVHELLDATRGINDGSEEFYPEFGLRAFCVLDDGEEYVVDFLIGPEFKAFYVLTRDEQRYCIVDRASINALIRPLAAGLPKWENEAK